MARISLMLTVVLIGWVLGATLARAQAPLMFQGFLETEDGASVSGDLPMVFRVYDDPHDAEPLDEIGVDPDPPFVVQVDDGLFVVDLAALFDDADVEAGLVAMQPLWLEIEVDGDLLGEVDEEGQLQARRVPLGAVLTSMYARVAGQLSGPMAGDLDLAGHELRNPVIHNARDAPENPARGQLWFDTSGGALMSWNGLDWVGMGSEPEQVAAALVVSDGFRTQVVEHLVAQHLEAIRGPRGEDADPAEVAQALVANPDFVGSVVASLFEQHAGDLTGPQGPPGRGLEDLDPNLLTSLFEQSHEAGDVPQPIGSGAVSTVSVPDRGAIRSVTVEVDIDHPDIGRLRVTLIPPDGPEIVLHDHSDQGVVGLIAIFGGDRQPASPPDGMNALQGHETSGLWTLWAVGDAPNEPGTLARFRLNLTYLSSEVVRLDGTLLLANEQGAQNVVRSGEDGSLEIRSGSGAGLSIGPDGSGLVRVEGEGLAVGEAEATGGTLVAGEDGSLVLESGSGGRVSIGTQAPLTTVWSVTEPHIDEQGTFRSSGTTAIAVDADALYLAGWDLDDGRHQMWRMEKRRPEDGALLWQVRENPSEHNDTAHAIAVQGASIYVGGMDNLPSLARTARWRVERRAASNGALEATFVDVDSDYSVVLGVAADAGGVYLAGYQRRPDGGPGDWRVEKRSLDDLQRLWGDIPSYSPEWDIANDIAVDGTGLYVVGYEHYDPEAAEWRQRARIEKRDRGTGAISWFEYVIPPPPFDDVNQYPGVYAYGVAVDATGLYVAGTVRHHNNRTNAWIAKRRLDDGGPIWIQMLEHLGVPSHTADRLAVDASGVYVLGSPGGSGYLDWHVEHRRLDNGELVSSWTRARSPGIDDAKGLSRDASGVYVVGIDNNSDGDGVWSVIKLTALANALSVEGDFAATGTKAFVIDHPLDPARQLAHACIEGPEAAVYYRGEATLEDGLADIRLPAYFEALTRQKDRTVTLTNVGGADPIFVDPAPGGALVGDGAFRVRLPTPGSSQRFVWEVKAVRKDVPHLAVER